jgi:hypothetical protein
MANAFSTASLKGLMKPIIENVPTYEVAFPRTPHFPLVLTRAELTQVPNNHDVLELQFKGHITSAKDKIVDSDPVIFTMTMNGKKKVWVGYVHHLSPITKPAQSALKIVAVSTTYVMKESNQKVYHNVTADQVVSRVAKSHGLKADTQRHPRVHPTVSNTGLSEWQLIRRLALQSGFGLVVDGTTIKFKSKDQLFNDSLAKGLYFTYNNTGVPVMSQYATLFSFTPALSDNAPEMGGARVERVVNGVSTVDNKALTTRHRAPSKRRTATRGVRGASS